MSTSSGSILLDVRDLSVRFKTRDGVVKAVSNLSFTLRRGETLGVVGESGSGKSVTSLAIMGLLNRAYTEIEGEILFEGTDLLKLSKDELRKVRGRDVSMIFQDPFACLHPMYRVGAQIAEAVRAHSKVSKSACLGSCRRAPGRGRDPEPRDPRAGLPAPVLGRDAPARHDRDGTRPQPGRPDRR